MVWALGQTWSTYINFGFVLNASGARTMGQEIKTRIYIFDCSPSIRIQGDKHLGQLAKRGALGSFRQRLLALEVVELPTCSFSVGSARPQREVGHDDNRGKRSRWRASRRMWANSARRPPTSDNTAHSQHGFRSFAAKDTRRTHRHCSGNSLQGPLARKLQSATSASGASPFLSSSKHPRPRRPTLDDAGEDDTLV